MEEALQIHLRFRSNLLVHHMDDWYKEAYTSGLFRYQRHHMLRLFHALVEKADRRLTIGEDMATEYAQRFANDFIPFQNTVHVQEFRRKVESFSGTARDRKAILYFGSVLPFAQEQSVHDTVKTLESLWERNTIDAPLLRIVAPANHIVRIRAIFGDKKYLELVEMKNEPDQFEREIARSDALLLPANFGEAAIQYLRYSMPTKLPGYLASGRPVLAYSPDELAQSRYLRRNQVAEVVGLRSQNSLREGLSRVLNPAVAEALSSRAYAVALKNHDASTVKNHFQHLLKELRK